MRKAPADPQRALETSVMANSSSDGTAGPGGSPGGAGDSAEDALTGHFYEELRGIAQRLFARERGDHTLQPTAVVNEACVRLLTTSRLPDLPREQRLALASRVLKQVLIDHARGKGADKRGAGQVRVELEPELRSESVTFVDFDAIHAALERLAALHARQAEVVSLRVFGGLSMEQIAAVVGTSKRTIESDWTVARAWLRRELSGDRPGDA
jgi:RNA polymerase sigma-70 factor, ECF subfamily